MPSNDKLSDHERLIKISSGQPQNPHFLKQISADSRKLHPNFNIPIYLCIQISDTCSLEVL